MTHADLDLEPNGNQGIHEAAGIEGLGPNVVPRRVADGRYRIDLPSGIRLDVDQRRKVVLVCDVSGSILAIGINRTEGYAEAMDVRVLGNGAKGFEAQDSGHKGCVEPDGTIRLSLHQGQNLVFRFPSVE